MKELIPFRVGQTRLSNIVQSRFEREKTPFAKPVKNKLNVTHRKNYVRIEKEFIEAKFILHQKLDRKEKLTEHLCFIIEENENRKAKKLQQLMDELNEDASREDYQMLPVYDQEEICSSCGGFPESATDDETSAATGKPAITKSTK